MADEDTKRAAVGYVVAVIGSLSRAAAHYGVSILQLKAWLSGGHPIPKPVFLSAVEFLLNAKDAELEAARQMVERSDLPAMTPALERLLERRR